MYNGDWIEQHDGTFIVSIEPDSPITEDLPTGLPGQTLTDLRFELFNRGDTLLAGKRYLDSNGRLRLCVQGPAGPCIPAKDGEHRQADGSLELLARLCGIVWQEH